MKTKLQKFCGSILALTVLLSSFSTAIFGASVSEEEARMQAEADFTKAELSELATV